MNLEELERRLTNIEDIEAIKQLKARYCEICDDDHNPERITSIFTADGIWEGRGIATAKGHAEIKELFQTFQKTISYAQHMVLNPIIEIDNDRANAIWYFFGPFTFYKDNQAKWQAARYHDEYRKVDGQWKIQHLKVRGPRMIANYETGWAK